MLKFGLIIGLTCALLANTIVCSTGVPPRPNNNNHTDYTDKNFVTDFKEFMGGLVGDLANLLMPAVDATSFSCGSRIGLFRDTFDCARYYECSKVRNSTHACPKGEGFDKVTLKCVPRERAHCPYGPVDPHYKCQASGWQINPANCSAFYFCVGKKAYTGTCEPEERFDQYLKLCLEKDAASCYNGDLQKNKTA